MLGGRWKVFRGQNESWLEEYRLLHRDKNGMLVKEVMTRLQHRDTD